MRPLTSRPLTSRQREVLEFIAGHQKENGYPPTLREIGAAMDIRSTNGVRDHLNALVRKGCLIETRASGTGSKGGKCRAIQLTPMGLEQALVQPMPPLVEPPAPSLELVLSMARRLPTHDFRRLVLELSNTLASATP